MEKIVFLSTYSFNEPVIKNRLTPFLDYALDRGFAVSLVNPVGGHYKRNSDSHFTHIPIDLPQANRGNFIARTFREMLLAWRIMHAAPHGDYVFVTIPSMFLLFFANWLKASVQLLDVRDLTWEYLRDQGLINGFAKKLFRYIALHRIPNFDYVSVTNESEYDYLRKNNVVSMDRLIICSNGISLEQFESVSTDVQHNKRKRKRPLITYVGNVGVAQNLATLVEAARQLPNVDFRIVGGGSDWQRVRDKTTGLSNVEMTGRVDWSEIPSLYLDSDILYAQLTAYFSSAMPSKLYEYLATGKRVVYGGKGQAIKFLSEFYSVKVIEPDDVTALIQSINDLIADPDGLDLNWKNRELIAARYIREKAVARFFQKFLEQKLK